MSAPLAQPTGTVTIGVDLASKSDYTAISVAEIDGWLDGFTEPGPGSLFMPVPIRVDGYRIRHLERFNGLPYPAVAERVAEVVEGVLKRRPPRVALYVDQTGLGGPVLDIIRDRLHGVPVTIVGATFTHGDRLTQRMEDGKRVASVGKAWLVSRLQALLQTHRIKLPSNLPLASVVTRELLDYEIKVSEDGNDTYGAFRVGSHDDTVTALGLSVLHDPQRYAAGTVSQADGRGVEPHGLYVRLPRRMVG